MDTRFSWVLELMVLVVLGAVRCVRLKALIEGVARELEEVRKMIPIHCLLLALLG